MNWSEIDARFPDAGVMWDRDVAPTLDWEPRFRERDGVLWADCESSYCRRDVHWANRSTTVAHCRCRVWEPTLKQWWTHPKWDRASRIFRLNDDLREGRLIILGTPWPSESGGCHDDRVDSFAYAHRHLWPVRGPVGPFDVD